MRPISNIVKTTPHITGGRALGVAQRGILGYGVM
jgi:hypothetical protein